NPGFPVHAAPALTEISLHNTLTGQSPSYTYTDSNGVQHTGTPQLLGATVTGALTAAASNPKNVWYTNNNVTLGDCTINGTIVVTGAGKKIVVDGNAQVTAASGMPAVVVAGDIQFAANIDVK